jgi:hypothetical protein
MSHYRIDFSGALVTAELQRLLILRDAPRQDFYTTSPAINGGYFILLAEWIDEVCDQLEPHQQRQIAKLQRVIDDLHFMHSHYKIKKKVSTKK